jgi:hypothetical protein
MISRNEESILDPVPVNVMPWFGMVGSYLSVSGHGMSNATEFTVTECR